MTYVSRKLLLLWVLSLTLAMAAAAHSQSPSNPPVPSQFVTAKTAFLSFEGVPFGFHADDIRNVYGSVYRALVAEGHYRFTEVPADAELAFELSIRTDNENGSSYHSLQLRVREIKTGVTLWTMAETISNNTLKSSDPAAARLITSLRALISGKLP